MKFRSTLDQHSPAAASRALGPSVWRLPGRGLAEARRGSLLVLGIILGRRPLSVSADGRHVPLVVHGTASQARLTDARRQGPYVSNSIRTSRYTPWDFVPKQLVFQFSRLHNFYFLLTSVFQMLGWGSVGKFTSILPLLFFVALTILKEGWDDLRRHRLDRVENSSPVTALARVERRRPGEGGVQGRGARWWKWPSQADAGVGEEEEILSDHGLDGLTWQDRRWMDVKVGDVIKLGRDEAVPADIVILHATGSNRTAYIETMALDGETNLKCRQVCPAFPRLGTIDEMARCPTAITVVAEDPNPDLYRFDGRLSLDGGKETRPLTCAEVVYRGSVVRNTEAVVGLVINTGEECKMRMNANQHPAAKRPALESATNRVVVALVLYVVVVSLGLTAGYLNWQRAEELSSWYLARAAVPLIHTVFGFVILLNNVIPLSLYVTLEFVKLGQLWFLNRDLAMYDEETDTPARCNTNTILENLGQVGHVFTDKTGTLTENLMRFRKVSIAGTVWTHDAIPATGSGTISGSVPFRPDTIHEDDEQQEQRQQHRQQQQSRSNPQEGDQDRDREPSTADLISYIRQRPYSAFARKAHEFLLAMALCHTCLPERIGDGSNGIQYQSSSPDELALVEAARELGYVVADRTAETVTVAIEGEQEPRVYQILDVVEFSSGRSRMSIVVKGPDRRITVICKGADSKVLPLLRMSQQARRRAGEVRASVELDHEMNRLSDQFNMITANSPTALRRRLSASPAAMAPAVSALKRRSLDVGRLSRDTEISAPSPTAAAQRRASLDYHLRSLPAPPPPQPIDDDAAVFAKCFYHLDAFATAGLRTLVFAQRHLTESEYASWKATFGAATTSLVDRQARIEEAAELLERELDLLGATAIEDKLQRGVPDTVDKLRRAGIKIWMLTGDKRETAINIAHAARICRPGSDVYVLDSERGDLHGQLDEIEADLERGGVVHSVVVIDGRTLGEIEQDLDPVSDSDSDPLSLGRRFCAVAPFLDSVICCRASPAQKALLVRSVRARLGHGPNGGLTLAIGDGANDLAMIEASHVGVGISGREGLQAARVADYAIAQFRFLQRLLLVHGRWNYVRTTKFVLATFWKEMFVYLPTTLFQYRCGYSGTSLYQEASLMVFNTLFTSLCVMYMGVFEQDLRADTLLAVPELYVYGRTGRGMNLSRYLAWTANAVLHGVAAWFLLLWLGLGSGGTGSIGHDQGLYALGHAAFTVVVLWANFRLLVLETHSKTWITLGCFAVSTIGWWLWGILLDTIAAPAPSPYAIRHTFTRIYGRDPSWWCSVLGTLVTLGVAEGGFRVVSNMIRGRVARRAMMRSEEDAEEAREQQEQTLSFSTSVESVVTESATSVLKAKVVVGRLGRKRWWGGRRGGRGGGSKERWSAAWDVRLWQEIEQEEGAREWFAAVVREDGI